jgi:cellulose synthase/poly-beta-1,6-N-acetylglucosamine synthase-like glycosyltransferase
MSPFCAGKCLDEEEIARRQNTRKRGSMKAEPAKLQMPLAAVTAIIPAYNEAANIEATIRSIQSQTYHVTQVIVVDDCSTDGTGDIARELGATVLRPPRNTGSKAAAQSYALPYVQTKFCVAIDADTEIDPEGIGHLMRSLADPYVAAASGFVLPRYVTTIWERGRYVEYLFAFTFFKAVQDFFDKPLIASGCFAAYRVDPIREAGGWSNRTLAEDMDLTWSLYRAGHKVRFVSDAVCYPIEPHDFHFVSKQLRRWSHGFIQNVRLHWRHLVHQPYLRSMVMIGIWDATVASFASLLLLPLLTVFFHPAFAFGFLIDLPAIAVPVLSKGWQRGEVGRAIFSLPCFLVLRVVSSVFMLRAVWMECVMVKPLLVYEKGH